MHYHFPNGDSHHQVESILVVHPWGEITLTKQIKEGDVVRFDLDIADVEAERLDLILNLNRIEHLKSSFAEVNLATMRAALVRLANPDDDIHAGVGGPWQDFASIILTGKPVPAR